MVVVVVVVVEVGAVVDTVVTDKFVSSLPIARSVSPDGNTSSES